MIRAKPEDDHYFRAVSSDILTSKFSDDRYYMTMLIYPEPEDSDDIPQYDIFVNMNLYDKDGNLIGIVRTDTEKKRWSSFARRILTITHM